MNWLTEIEKYKEQFIRDLSDVVAIPSVKDETSVSAGAPFGAACREALDFMMKLAEKEGFETNIYDGYAGVISYGEGDESVALLAHLDVVPAGEGWSQDPFTTVVKDGYIFGRGVLDDKGAAMSGFYALKMMREHNIHPNKKIMIIYGCDEESGSACMKYYKEHGEIPVKGFTPDANFPVIYGEKGGLHMHLKGRADTVISRMHAGERANIVIGKASLFVREWDDDKLDQFDFYLNTYQLKGSITTCAKGAELSIEGTFAHAAMPYLGDNAALHLLNFVGCAFHDKFAKDTYEMLKDWQGKPLGIHMEGAYMGFLTMNTGIVDIEDDGTTKIVIDIRYPNDADVDYIVNCFQNKVKELDYALEAVKDHDSKPLFVDPNADLVQTLYGVYQKYTKDTFTPNITIGGGTYAREFDNFVAFGPEFPNQKEPEGLFVGGCHQKDEGVCIDNLLKAAAIYTEALEKLAE